jgi:hypothetical protein
MPTGHPPRIPVVVSPPLSTSPRPTRGRPRRRKTFSSLSPRHATCPTGPGDGSSRRSR